MFENELQTRAAICGTGCLLGLVFVTGPPSHSYSDRARRDPLPRPRCRPGGDPCGLVRDALHARHLRDRGPDRCRKEELRRQAALLLVRGGRDGISSCRCLRGTGRDIPCGEDRYLPRIYRRRDDLPAALRIPAEDHPVCDGCRHGCDPRHIREERAREERILGGLFRNRRDRACTSPGPGNGSGRLSGLSRVRGDEGSGPLIHPVPGISFIPGPISPGEEDHRTGTEHKSEKTGRLDQV